MWIASQEGHTAVVKELLNANASVDLARQVGTSGYLLNEEDTLFPTETNFLKKIV